MSSEKISIFVVDASPVWRKILINIIESTSDMSVAGEINSSQGAILMLEEIDPDIVMLEINARDRATLTDTISQLHTIKPDVRIILCVERNDKDKVVAGLDKGVSDFIVKPYSDTHVHRVVRECMSRLPQ